MDFFLSFLLTLYTTSSTYNMMVIELQSFNSAVNNAKNIYLKTDFVSTYIVFFVLGRVLGQNIAT
jgi:hypothetical protein